MCNHVLPKRHLKQCKLHSNHTRCKFDLCAFIHVEATNALEFMKTENEALLLNINDINKYIEALEAKASETHNFIDKLMEIEKKLEMLDNN